MRLVQDLTNDRLVIEDDQKNEISWRDLFISFNDLFELMQGKLSSLCMDDEDDRAQFIACCLDEAVSDEESTMQEVPDDAILLTPDEARAMLNASMGEQFDPDDHDAAVTALDEQLECDDTEKE